MNRQRHDTTNNCVELVISQNETDLRDGEDPNGGTFTVGAPAWAAFMTEVYRRKPQPPDWPRPDMGRIVAHWP